MDLVLPTIIITTVVVVMMGCRVVGTNAITMALGALGRRGYRGVWDSKVRL